MYVHSLVNLVINQHSLKKAEVQETLSGYGLDTGGCVLILKEHLKQHLFEHKGIFPDPHRWYIEPDHYFEYGA